MKHLLEIETDEWLLEIDGLPVKFEKVISVTFDGKVVQRYNSRHERMWILMKSPRSTTARLWLEEMTEF